MAGGRCHKRRGSSPIVGVDDSGVDRVPARRMRRRGIRVNSKGILYVPDSEDEDSEMEVEEDGGVAGKEAVEGPPCVVLEGAPHVVPEAAPIQATAGGVDGRSVLIEGPMANNMTAGDDLKEVHPDVPEALKEVLAHMDPIYHRVFVLHLGQVRADLVGDGHKLDLPHVAHVLVLHLGWVRPDDLGHGPGDKLDLPLLSPVLDLHSSQANGVDARVGVLYLYEGAESEHGREEAIGAQFKF